MQDTLKESIKYAVFFTGTIKDTIINGYYAHKQLNQTQWTFTKDVKSAKLYSTKKGALDRIQHQRGCYKNLSANIVTVSIITEIVYDIKNIKKYGTDENLY